MQAEIKKIAKKPKKTTKPLLIPVGTIINLADEKEKARFVEEHPTFLQMDTPKDDLLRVIKKSAKDAGPYGVIANKTIPKDTRIGEYGGEIIVQRTKNKKIPRIQFQPSEKEIRDKITGKKNRELTILERRKLKNYLENFESIVSSYSFLLSLANTKVISLLGHEKANILHLVNASPNGLENVSVNVVTKNEQDLVEFSAKREIFEGEELIIDYGKRYGVDQTFKHLHPWSVLSKAKLTDLSKTEYYSENPIELSDNDRDLLGTAATHLFIPRIYEDNNRWQKCTADQINLKVCIEVNPLPGNKQEFEALPTQQFITFLMFASLKQNDAIVAKIIEKGANVDFVTKNNRSAWYIASANNNGATPPTDICRLLANAILKFYKERTWKIADYRQYIKDNLKTIDPEKDKNVLTAILFPNSTARKISEFKKGGARKRKISPVPPTPVKQKKPLLIGTESLKLSESVTAYPHKAKEHLTKQPSPAQQILPETIPFYSLPEVLTSPPPAPSAPIAFNNELKTGYTRRTQEYLSEPSSSIHQAPADTTFLHPLPKLLASPTTVIPIPHNEIMEVTESKGYSIMPESYMHYGSYPTQFSPYSFSQLISIPAIFFNRGTDNMEGVGLPAQFGNPITPALYSTTLPSYGRDMTLSAETPPQRLSSPYSLPSDNFIKLKDSIGLSNFRKIAGETATKEEFRMFAVLSKYKAESMDTLVAQGAVTAPQQYMTWSTGQVIAGWLQIIENREQILSLAKKWASCDVTQLPDDAKVCHGDQSAYVQARTNFSKKIPGFFRTFQAILDDPAYLKRLLNELPYDCPKAVSKNKSRYTSQRFNPNLEGFRKIMPSLTVKEYFIIIKLSHLCILKNIIGKDGLSLLRSPFRTKKLANIEIEAVFNSITPAAVSSLFLINNPDGPRSAFKIDVETFLDKNKPFFMARGWQEDDFNPGNWGVSLPFSATTSREDAKAEAKLRRNQRIHSTLEKDLKMAFRVPHPAQPQSLQQVKYRNIAQESISSHASSSLTRTAHLRFFKSRPVTTPVDMKKFSFNQTDDTVISPDPGVF